MLSPVSHRKLVSSRYRVWCTPSLAVKSPSSLIDRIKSSCVGQRMDALERTTVPVVNPCWFALVGQITFADS